MAYTYHNIGQLKSALGSGGQSTENLGYLYDTAWNLNKRTNAGTPTTFAVDVKNQLTSVGSTSYAYDDNGNLTGGGARVFGYDDENQLAQVLWGNGAYLTDFGYDGRGRLRTRKEYTWAGGGSSTPLVSSSPQGTLRNNWEGWVGFQFVVGSSALTVTELERWVVSGNANTHTVKLFYANGTAVPGGEVTVSTSGKPAGQFTYATLASPVLLAAGTTYAVMSREYSGGDRWHDYAGTQITLTAAACGAWSVWAYPTPPPYYGDLNGGGKSHGPVGLKYRTGGSWTLTSETRYLYDGMRVIQERDGNNTPTVAYTRGNDLSGSLEGAGGIGGLLARSHGYSGGTFSTHSFYHADGNGNVTYLISSGQSQVAGYQYDPYGNLLSIYDSLPSGGNRYRFSSKEQMPNSGLYYYGYRFYDPFLQRWLNRDPIGEVGGINLYGFVGNAPLGRFDPDGRGYFIPALFLLLLAGDEAHEPPSVEWGVALCGGGQDTAFIQIVRYPDGQWKVDNGSGTSWLLGGKKSTSPFYPDFGLPGSFMDEPHGWPVSTRALFEVCRVCLCRGQVVSVGPCKFWQGGDNSKLEDFQGFPGPSRYFLSTVNKEFPGTIAF